ncbi:MAG: hypothetical protein KZQ58_06365, partial [gamma proteobacterium symbiont of Bathyaustriella thionipta]|nr:hypothetical protein [gamma proteobacterium symbiont of Bathyaustriella thionipta]
RGVNAIVSVLKESQLQLSPAGIGLNIAAGQILDPIDDMTERLSSVMVASIVSISIQKTGYELGRHLSFFALGILLLFFIPLLWLRSYANWLSAPLLKAVLLLLILRLLLPLSAAISSYAYTQLFAPQIEQALQELSSLSDQYSHSDPFSNSQESSVLDYFSSDENSQIEQLKQAFEQIFSRAEEIIHALLQLITAYSGLFILQVILLPLSLLWLMLRLLQAKIPHRWLTRIFHPVALKSS